MTADTYSSLLGFLIMGTGNDNNAWGGNANAAVFQILEDAIAGALTSTVTGGTLDLSGSPPPAAASQARYAALIFNGTLGGSQLVQVPNLAKFWFVQNSTAGAFTLKFQTPAAVVSTAIPQNSGWQVVYCDGANNITVFPFNTKQIEMPDGTVGAPAFSNINEPTSGWYRNGTQDWRLSISGADVLQVTGPSAATPSVINILSPGTFQIAGASFPGAAFEQSYAGINLPAGRWLWEDGGAYSRPVANGGSVDTYKALFAALTLATTGNTHTSTTIDNLPIDLRGRGLEGSILEGSTIQSGTTVISFTATSMVLSLPTTGTNTGVAVRLFPWGNGDAATTFNVPDRRYRGLIGRDNMNNNPANRSSLFAGTHLNTTGGEEAHTLTLPETVAHSHVNTLTDPGHGHDIAAGNNASGTTGNAFIAALSSVGGSNIPYGGSLGGTQSAKTNITINNASAGGGGAHNNMHQFGITNFIIAY